MRIENGGGSGVVVQGGKVTMRNSSVSGNLARGAGADGSLGITVKSWGNNAIDGNVSNTIGTITTIALQ